MSGMRRRRVAVITGAIGSGKSTVAGMFERLGAKVVSADTLAKAATEKEGKAFDAVVEAFGQEILDEHKQINRRELGKLVFNDLTSRSRLQSILLPVIRDMAEMEFCRLENAGSSLIVYEAPIFFEAGLSRADFCAVICVIAKREQCISRASERLHLTQAEVEARLDSQMPLNLKQSMSDFVIDNSSTEEHTFEQVSSIYKKLIAICMFFLVVFFSASQSSCAERANLVTTTDSLPKESDTSKSALLSSNLRGWDYLYGLLVGEGVDPLAAANLFSDSRMPKYETVYFSARPKESKNIYRFVNTKKTRANALDFWNKHRAFFRSAEGKYPVPAGVILAILQVESHCGEFTGKERVFYRLARLVTASNPNTINENIKYNKKLFKDLRLEEVTKRAVWLRDTFLPHLIATFSIARSKQSHPLDIRGSIAGGIGLPQFLPGNVYRYGVDADGDREVNLDQPADAILSVSRFLYENGWNKNKLSIQEKREVLSKYNQSTPYVDTIIAMADQLSASLNPKLK